MLRPKRCTTRWRKTLRSRYQWRTSQAGDFTARIERGDGAIGSGHILIGEAWVATHCHLPPGIFTQVSVQRT